MDYYEEQVRKCDVFNMVSKNEEGEGKREGGRGKGEEEEEG